MRADTHHTLPPILAGVASALRRPQLAVGTGEARWAGAGVAALACVHAGGAIATGLMVGAVVQICGCA